MGGELKLLVMCTIFKKNDKLDVSVPKEELVLDTGSPLHPTSQRPLELSSVTPQKNHICEGRGPSGTAVGQPDVRGVDSARWPNSNPPGRVGQERLLIPVIGSAVDVEGGGVQQNDGNGSGTSGSVDETCCEWMTLKVRKGATHPKLEPHATACDDL